VTDDLIGKTYTLPWGTTAKVVGRDPLFPDEDRWIVQATNRDGKLASWGTSGEGIRSKLVEDVPADAKPVPVYLRCMVEPVKFGGGLLEIGFWTGPPVGKEHFDQTPHYVGRLHLKPAEWDELSAAMFDHVNPDRFQVEIINQR